MVTEELAQLLLALDDGQQLTESLTSSEAIERLGKHLLRVARRLRTPSDVPAVGDRAALVNRAVDALGPEFAGDRVSVPPRLLKGVGPRSGLAIVLPEHPRIPLTSSELLVNGHGEPSFGSVLKEEFRCAADVDLICAFVGFTGFAPLKDEFRDLVARGGRVRVITSTYLGSTSGKALDELVRLGAEVRVNYQGHATKLHAKAWLFRRPSELDTAFVGSSNLSEAALYSGLEWNVRLARADAAAVFTRIQQTFESYWNTSSFETYDVSDRERLDAALQEAKGYATSGYGRKADRAIAKLTAQLADAYEAIALTAKPHQQQVLDTLRLRRDEFDEHRHLVVAATGTGKTVMAALDYARLCEDGRPRPSLLFVAHREQILLQARETFRRALKDPAFGDLLSNSTAAPQADRHVFAMVQTMHNRLPRVDPDAYDVVYIDEAHHGAAATWRDVIGHFHPRELVGLTATPERADGTSIADLFGGGYTTELRLWEAVDDQLLVPFEYVGVDDGTDLRQLAWHRGDYAIGDLSSLYTGDHERVKLVLEAINRWVESPAEMRALGFCVSRQHARFMTEQFQQFGFHAEHLDGDHDLDHRLEVLARLRDGHLQVVFSVDVLGEGVDAPDVDTVLLLRPTQSPVLFAQQLGRGLRTAPGKSSCLVLDFIGQHRAEYRFADRLQALVDPTHGTVLDQAESEFPFLPAGCAINLERVAAERVLASLRATAAPKGIRGLRTDLESRGSASLDEFLTDTGRTPEQLYAADARKMSWTKLRRLVGTATAPPENPDPALQQSEDQLLRRIGFVQHVSDRLRVDTWTRWLQQAAPPPVERLSVAEQRLAMQLMHLLAMTPDTLDQGFAALWRHPAVLDELSDLFAINLTRLDVASQPLEGLAAVPLMANARYTRAEVFAATGVSTPGRPKEHREGVFFVSETRVQLMFVTLNKDSARFSSETQYKDHALSPDLFHWESPNNWRQGAPSMRRCIGQGSEASRHRLLFVRERSAGPIEGTFRCFGQVDLDGDMIGDRPVALTWRLRQALPELVFETVSLLAAG